MIKGFISFKDNKIPFVIENHRMELFSDSGITKDFAKEYNFKNDYILVGQCYYDGIEGRAATFLWNVQ